MVFSALLLSALAGILQMRGSQAALCALRALPATPPAADRGAGPGYVRRGCRICARSPLSRLSCRVGGQEIGIVSPDLQSLLASEEGGDRRYRRRRATSTASYSSDRIAP